MANKSGRKMLLQRSSTKMLLPVIAVRPLSTETARPRPTRSASKLIVTAVTGLQHTTRFIGRRKDRKEKPIETFRRIAKSVKIITSVCLTIKRYAQKGAELEWESLEANLKLCAEFDSLAAFLLNKSDIPNVPAKASDTVKGILRKPSGSRTKKEVQTLQWFLRENDTFQGYPLESQRELCQCMQYQSYEARRIVLKRGHEPEAFYIVLSGNVTVSQMEEGQSPLVKDIVEGGSFGEKALMNDSHRTSTVVCKSNVELLSVLKDDFDRIIKGPRLQSQDRHLKFLRTLPLFENFPVEELVQSEDAFFQSYIRKGKLVQPPIPSTEYIIVVQSGSCNLIAKIPAPKKENSSSKIVRRNSLERLFPLETCKMAIEEEQEMSKLLSSLQWETKHVRDSIKSHLLLGDRDVDVVLDRSNKKTSSDVFQLRPSTSNAAKVSSSKSRRPTTSHFAGRVPRDLHESKPTSRDRKSTFFQHRKPAQTSVVQSQDDQSYIFAMVSTLNEGRVYGLEKLVGTENLDLYLVSDGAECIFISSKFFLNHCNQQVLSVLGDMIVTYPSEKFIQAKVIREAEWSNYKSQLTQDIVKQAAAKKKNNLLI